ncbi:Glucose oxidase [Escovopsis weberi]|uniref:Glucose oxidase n=1 Tax=Escovopsis weberi TaxID=150374 RepID=A0A0M9VSV2_ESCWE|nr:Glucose oxidase [Escovopsis weberi]
MKPLLLLAAAAASVRGESFDYLIAGAGTAGLVLANRLSARANVTVAVIEPGPDVSRDPAVQSASAFDFAHYNRSINWEWTSAGQPQLGGRALSYRAGRAIGGTSAVNGMVYIRGDKAQYDAWEELGNPGWNWASLFSHHKALETFTPPTPAQAAHGGSFEPRDHGRTGPLAAGFPLGLSNSTFHEAARATWRALGLEEIRDLNGGATRGFAIAPQTLERDVGTRASSARAYYEPVRGRANLKIIRGAVQRITWRRDRGGEAVASGFEYVDAQGGLVRVGARREVVLSASAFVSPLILESSGVGNPRILSSLGIATKVSLPGVGESMQDHQSVVSVYSLKRPLAGKLPFSTMVTALDLFGGGGPTASVAASTRAKLAQWAQQASAACGGAISAAAALRRFRVQHDLIFRRNATVAELFPTNAAGSSSVVAQYWTTMAFSWGSVHLSAAPGGVARPAIDPRTLAVGLDAEMLERVGRLSQRAYGTAPLGDLFADNTAPGYGVLPRNATDAQWAAFVRATATNGLHVVGTCAMLPRALGGVVDAAARVYGTRNVRVVDASIIPMQVSGHTMGPLYGVAEKAAAIIIAGDA